MSRATEIVNSGRFRIALVAVVVAVVFAQDAIWGNDTAEVVGALEQKYGLEQVEWRENGRYERDTLVVDGRDLTDECHVSGDWGPWTTWRSSASAETSGSRRSAGEQRAGIASRAWTSPAA